MKKVTFSVAAILMLAATSCKKDYTCTCTSSAGGASATSTVTLKDVTKSDAETACNGYESSVSAGGVTSSTTCSLD